MFKKNFQSQNNIQKKSHLDKSEVAKKSHTANLRNSDSAQEFKHRKLKPSALGVHNEDNKHYQIDFKVLEQLLNARINTKPASRESDPQKPELQPQNQNSVQAEPRFLLNSPHRVQQTVREIHWNKLQLTAPTESSVER